MGSERAVPEVVKVDVTGRRRYSARFKHELVAKCLQPGASVAKLSIDLGLNPNLVRKWMRQELRSQSETRMLPVTLSVRPPTLPSAEVAQSAGIEIMCERWAIRIGSDVSTEQIAAIVQALR
jgi:transposase-like protein